MQAVILVGGLGTRLGALISDKNKPMAPVAGKPFLEYLLRRLKRSGIDEVVLCVGHRGELIRDYFGTGDALGLRLLYSQERELLGTGGALRLARDLITADPFLAMNGDSFFPIPVGEFVAFHQRAGAHVSLALTRTDQPERFGTVEVDDAGRVLRFVEKGQGRAGGLINGGVYLFRREVLDGIPEGRPVSLEKEVFPSLVGRGLYGVSFSAYFVDMGVPEDYLKLQADPRPLNDALA